MKRIFKASLSYIVIIIMALLQSVNYHFFIVDNDYAPAGLNGIITMIQYKTGFSISYMSLMINIPLCIIAFFFLEKRYAIRTLVFTLVNSFSYLYLQKAGLENLKYDEYLEQYAREHFHMQRRNEDVYIIR